MKKGLPQIDYRTKVGTDAWRRRHDEGTRKLSAWRRLHALMPHEEVKKVASLDMTSTQLAKIVEKAGEKK